MGGRGDDQHWLADGRHDEADRRSFAVLLVVAGLLFSGIALAHRQHRAHSSNPGDACPVTASGGLVAFDADTGAVRWTNVVPPNSHLEVRDGTEGHGEVHLVTPVKEDRPSVDRTIDAATGSVTACTTGPVPASDAEGEDAGPLDDPITVGDLTVMRWGAGIRATDPAGTGVWGIDSAHDVTRLGDTMVLSVPVGKTGKQTTSRIDLRTGEALWTGGGMIAAPPTPDRPVITDQVLDRSKVQAIGLDDGTPRWSADVPGLERLNGRPYGYWADDLLVFQTDPGAAVSVIDGTDGSVRWQADGGSPGRNRKASDPGWVTSAVRSPDGDTVIVSVTAFVPGS